MKCPKCTYERTDLDHLKDPKICPNCGIYYHKWRSREARRSSQYSCRQSNSNILKQLLLSIFSRLVSVPEKVDPINFWGRVIIYVIFFIWGWYFINAGISWTKIGGSFLHSVILPFHEFGHVLFMPFGRFMSILGGSLFQVLMPLLLMLVFIFKQNDNFAASMMLWWSGQSFIDISPYIADAPYRALPLIMGMGEEAHDWGNLLTMMGKMDQSYAYATNSFNIGTSLIIISYCWAGYILYKQLMIVRKSQT